MALKAPPKMAVADDEERVVPTQPPPKIAMIVITVLPFVGLAVRGRRCSGTRPSGWTDLVLFLGLYVLCGFGITIGYPPHAHAPRVRGRRRR